MQKLVCRNAPWKGSGSSVSSGRLSGSSRTRHPLCFGFSAACPKVVYADTGLIDNVGVDLGKWGRGADRGHLEADRGPYDEPSDEAVR